MKNLSFELYNNPERCYPGSAMAGQIIFETTKSINCSKITVEPNGLSKVFFYRSIGHGRSRGYSNQEKYFSGSIILYESVNNPPAILPPGKYSYPFRFLFPKNCVPTFNDLKGKATVKYELIAKVHIRRGRNLTKKQPLTVCPILDFNTDLDLCRPVQLLTQNSELQVTAFLPRSAFLENEQIPFRLKIYNGGIRDVENAEIGIHYFAEFKGYPTTQKPKYSMKDFSTGKSHKNLLSVKLRPGQLCHLQHMFQIKSNNNPTIDNCPFLKNEFHFFVKVFLKGISKPLTFNYPIQISKVIVSLNPNELEEIVDEPIKKFFVPGQSSFERNPATFKYGPFPVESMLLTLLEIAEQNNPLNYAQ